MFVKIQNPKNLFVGLFFRKSCDFATYANIHSNKFAIEFNVKLDLEHGVRKSLEFLIRGFFVFKQFRKVGCFDIQKRSEVFIFDTGQQIGVFLVDVLNTFLGTQGS